MPDISVMIFTLNEETNLPNCLDSLNWCDDVIVVDSFSTDTTKQIAEQRNVRYFSNVFEGFGTQRNWALDNIDTKYSWILILDADERVPLELVEEMSKKIVEVDGPVAYRVRRRFYMWGRWLRRSGLYPTWVVRLVKKGSIRYANAGHAETQSVKGEMGALESDLIDENMKGLEEWFGRQNIYASKEAVYEIKTVKTSDIGNILSKDPVERRKALKAIAHLLPFRPFFFFLYSYIFKAGFLEGRDGFYFCYMKALYYAMIDIKKYDYRRVTRVNRE